jgi:hypothetical protein
MKIKALAAALLLFVTTTQSNPNWQAVTTSENKTFYIQNNSMGFGYDGKSRAVVYANGKIVNNVTNEYMAVQWHVALLHCKFKNGVLVITDTNGLTLVEVPFSFDGGSPTTRVAEAMCNANPQFNHYVKEH